MSLSYVVDGETELDSELFNPIIDRVNGDAGPLANMRAGLFNPLDYGAVGDGVTDDTAAFLAMNADAEAANGMIEMPALQFGISDLVQFNARNVIGSGGQSRRWDGATASGTEFVALHKNACVKLTCSGGVAGWFNFDGMDIATTGVIIGESNAGSYVNIGATNCAGNGIEIRSTQNGIATGLHATNNGGIGLAVIGNVGEFQIHQPQLDHNRKHQFWIGSLEPLPGGGNQKGKCSWVGGLTEWSQIYDEGTATGGSSTTIVDSGASWIVNDLAGAWVTKALGGANQEGRRISSNTATTITISPDWDVNPTTEDYLIEFPSVSIGGSGESKFFNTVHASGHGETPTVDVYWDGLSEISEAHFLDTAFIGGVNTIGLCLSGPYTNVYFRGATIHGALEGIRIIGAGGYIHQELPNFRACTTPITLHGGANFDIQVSSLNEGMRKDNIMFDAADSVDWVSISGEPGVRCIRRASGEIEWGSGSAGMDTNLRRAGAGQLATDFKFIAIQGIGVGNSAAATTLGTVTKKIEVFDTSGNSLGFVPVYGSIT